MTALALVPPSLPAEEAKVISDDLRAPFPASAIETKDNKRYISHDYIRDRVIEATCNRFDWDVTGVEYRADGLANRTDKQTKERFAATVMIVTGTLTIPGLGRRHGLGVQVLENNMGEDGYKMAESDAFKRAAMAFGVGLKQLYMGEDLAYRPAADQRTGEIVETHADPEQFPDDPALSINERYKRAIKRKDAVVIAELVKTVENYDHALVIKEQAEKAGVANGIITAALMARSDGPPEPAPKSNGTVVDQGRLLKGTKTQYQLNRIFAIAREIAMSDDDIKRYVKEQFCLDSRADLSGQQADQVIAWLESMREAPF